MGLTSSWVIGIYERRRPFRIPSETVVFNEIANTFKIWDRKSPFLWINSNVCIRKPLEQFQKMRILSYSIWSMYSDIIVVEFNSVDIFYEVVHYLLKHNR